MESLCNSRGFSSLPESGDGTKDSAQLSARPPSTAGFLRGKGATVLLQGGGERRQLEACGGVGIGGVVAARIGGVGRGLQQDGSTPDHEKGKIDKAGSFAVGCPWSL